MRISDWSSDVCSSDLAPPNLQVSALTAPERAVRGQTFRVEYSVTNSGGAPPALQGQWDDLIYLSRVPFLDLTSDRLVGSVRHTGGTDAGDISAVAPALLVPPHLGTDAFSVFALSAPAAPHSAGAPF